MNWMNEDFNDLDDLTTYSHDPRGVYSWIDSTDKSLENARKYFFEDNPVHFDTVSEVREIVITGMGGSAIAGDIALAVVGSLLPVPCRVVRGYTLPASIKQGSLVIVISYSGNTEEAVWAYTQAHNKGADIVVITTGGALENMASRHGKKVVKLECDYPAPRLALPHLMVAVLAVIASRFTDIDFIPDALSDAVSALKRGANRYSRNLEFEKNFAKKLAFDLHGVFPVIIASESTWPAALRFQAQLNENSSWPAHACMIPEMNHNEVVAYGQPGPAVKRTGIIFLRDKDDHPRVQFRQDFTSDLISRHVAWVHTIKGEGKTFTGRLISMMQTADYASYYLAVARGMNPMDIRAIDTLKERLGKLQ